MTSPETSGLLDLGKQLGFPTVTAGIEVAVVAHVAEFTTNVTYTPDDKECALKVVQEYNLALGAIAGATVVVDAPTVENMTWGPVIEASTAIYTTTLPKVCAAQGSATLTQASLTAVEQKRQHLITSTLTTVITTSGVSCGLTGVVNCPASAQSTTKTKITQTHLTAVPSGVKATFPESIFNSVQSTVRFGTGAKTIKATSGSPIAYTAPPTPTDDVHAAVDNPLSGETGSSNKKVVVGVIVGLGVPGVLAAVGAFMYVSPRRGRQRYLSLTRYNLGSIRGVRSMLR